jgi:hypothetical protein
MLDSFRTQPREALAGIIDRRKAREPAWEPPFSVRLLDRMFLQDSRLRDVFGKIALRVFGLKRDSAQS